MPEMPETTNGALRYLQPSAAPQNSPGISIDEALSRVDFRISRHPHITLDARVCKGCSARPCLTACPARLFVETAAGDVAFNYENCFECGTCYMVCGHEGALSWSYPPGGYGVRFHRS